MKFSTTLILVALMLCVASCKAQNSSNGRWTTLDSWYRQAPDNFGYEEKYEVSRQNFRQVSSGRWPLAQQMLQQQSIVPLSIHQAQGLTATQVKMPKGRAPFLVRAVYLNAGTGGFDIQQKGRQLVIFHGSLGHYAVPMKRSALIVFLKKRPTELFTEVSMAA